MKKSLLSLIALFLSILGYSQTFNVSGVNYEIIGSTNTVNAVSYTISSPTLVIPKTVVRPGTANKYAVVGIGFAAFDNEGLTSLTLSEGLLSIGGNAFDGNSLTSLIIPNSVTTITYNAFIDNQIATLDLGTGVSDIGLGAFKNNKLTSLVIPSNVQTMGNGVFMDNLIKYITIEAGVGNLGINTFSNNPVKSVTCEGTTPATLAASGFTTRNTVDLYIPDGTTAAYVTNPGALWTGFKSVAEESFVINFITYEVTSTNPNTVSAINYNVLGGPIVSIPATVTIASITYDVTEIGEDAFKQKGVSSLTLSEGLTEIGSRAFNANNLTSLVIPNSVTTIQYNVFTDNDLTTLDLGTGIEVIANGSFANNQLTSIIIPSSMLAMGGTVFYNNEITTVTVKAGVGQLGFRTFWENPLTTVISESTTPPTITTGGTEETFSPDRSTIDLIIPTGTLGVYVTNSGALWTGFKSVTQDPVLSINVSGFEAAYDVSVFGRSNRVEVSYNETVNLQNYAIYTTNGTIVSTGTESGLSNHYLSSGIYIIKLDFDKGTLSKKFTVN